MSAKQKLDIAIKNLKSYMEYAKTWDEEMKRNNPKAWQDALTAAAWLSVYKYGAKEYSKLAEKYILKIFG